MRRLGIPTPRKSVGAAFLLVLLVNFLVAPGGATTARVYTNQAAAGRDTVALAQFKDRVDQYVALRKKLLAKMPALKKPDDPFEINARKKALADSIRASRSNAKQGAVFIPGIAPRFLRIIRQDVRNRPKQDVITNLKEGPKEEALFSVNQVYPESKGVTTTPALLLANLPRLPDGLEYRFIGRHFILKDAEANIIVDFILDAVPLPKPPV